MTITDQEAVYEYYGIVPYTRVNSPLREDNNPSFSTYERNGHIRWKDFGTGDSGDIIDLVQVLEGISFQEAVELTRKVLESNPKRPHQTFPQKQKERTIFTSKDLSESELAYWRMRGVSIDQLRFENIESLKMLSVDGKFISTSTDSSPKFVYRYAEDSWKIYAPFEKEYKWLSNNIVTPFEIGVTGNSDCIVLSSKKDRMVFDNLNMPIDSVSLHSEGNIKPLVAELDKSLKKYDRILAMLDFDEAGERYSSQLLKMSKGRVTPIILDLDVRSFMNQLGLKDLDDIYVNRGDLFFKNFVISCLKKSVVKC